MKESCALRWKRMRNTEYYKELLDDSRDMVKESFSTFRRITERFIDPPEIQPITLKDVRAVGTNLLENKVDEKLQQVASSGKLPDINNVMEDAELLTEKIFDRLGEIVKSDKTQADWVLEKLANKKLTLGRIHGSFTEEEINIARTSGNFKTTLHGLCSRLAKSGVLSQEKVIDENGRKVWAYWITNPKENDETNSEEKDFENEDLADEYISGDDTISDVDVSGDEDMEIWRKPVFVTKPSKPSGKKAENGMKKIKKVD